MTHPVISSVKTINHQDFLSISDEVNNDRDDVLYMRLGVDDCPETLPSTQQMNTHTRECHECEFCNATFSQTKNLILHLKTHMRSSAQTERKDSTSLKEGFYHPTLKRPKNNISVFENKSSRKEKFEKKKANTQYYIFKEKGKIKKVVRTVFTPNPKAQQDVCKEVDMEVTDDMEVTNDVEVTVTKRTNDQEKLETAQFELKDMKDIEESSVEDELSSNLDDLLRSFEEEELSQSSDISTDPLVEDFTNHFDENELVISSAKVKMCVEDAFENIDQLDSRETEDEIDCMEITSGSDDYKCLLTLDLEDEILCQHLDGRPEAGAEARAQSSERETEKYFADKKITLKEKCSQCLLCYTTLGSFSSLLSHITAKHFQSEVNNMIKEKYPGFGKYEKLNEYKSQICDDCGERMSTRDQLQKHLGVEHNLLWDLYLRKVQKNKKFGQSSREVNNKEKILLKSTSGGKGHGNAKTSNKGTGKQSLNKKKITQTKTKRSAAKPEQVQTIANSVYWDSKLNLIPDENPYSRKFIFSTKARGGPRPVPASNRSLEAQRGANLAASLCEPYCSLCQVLLEPEARLRLADTELTGEDIKVPAQSAVWLPGSSNTVSRLLVCTKCALCVHEACWPSASSPGRSWECDGCQARERTGQESLCCICGQPGGALAVTTDRRLAHLACVLLLPEAAVRPDCVEVRGVPGKRSGVECLVCGERGRPAVHCQASPACTLAFHTDCAVKEPVDIVIGTEPGTIILRCSFCVEKFSLHEDDEDSKEDGQDLQLGETVTVRDSDQQSLAVVVEIVPEKYLAVAFDDGSYSDTLDPEDVRPITAEAELSLNCPVRVKFEGGLYSGVYKGEQWRHWYRVRTRHNTTLELDRSHITKRNQS